ncbi:MAG: AMP-binding protein, partial [Planctomycetes bacterium]|nr:AMP-binding protein [Planctomycetota bacterium]
LTTKQKHWNCDSLHYLDTGTSATPIELIRALKSRFPQASLRIYYGSTEVGAGTALLDADILRKPGSVGQASPGVDLKLSESGEICLRSDFITDGYFDDSKDSGVYNNYGLMSINYALRISECIDERHPVRNHLEETFRPHALRYFALLQDFIHSNGQGWIFGRSAGVLGQMQCLVFIEQILSKGWLNTQEESWARRACSKILDYMCDVFWDMEKNWFSFRDDNRSCYDYRTNLPMCWDLWRYFLQVENYAKIDEAKNPLQETDDTINTQPMCKEVISSVRRKTAYFIWSDGRERILMPIMGGPGWVSSDTMPRPFCPGLFEWTTGNNIPALCPRLRIDGSDYFPAWWPSSTRLMDEGDCAIYTVSYDHLVNDQGKKADFDLNWHVTYVFASGHFERRDVFHVNTDVQCEEIRMEILQGQAHPKSLSYPQVHQLQVRGNSNIDGLTLDDAEDISQDTNYVNYYSHAAKRWVFAGENILLAAGDYDITTVIDY